VEIRRIDIYKDIEGMSPALLPSPSVAGAISSSSATWETGTSSSSSAAASSSSSSLPCTPSDGDVDANVNDDRRRRNLHVDADEVDVEIADAVPAIDAASTSRASHRRASGRPTTTTTNVAQHAKKVIARKLIEGYELMGNGEVCLRCRMPLMIHGDGGGGRRDDDHHRVVDSDYLGTGAGRTTGVCVVCDEECASRIDFERRLVVFSAMQARQSSIDDDLDDDLGDDIGDDMDGRDIGRDGRDARTINSNANGDRARDGTTRGGWSDMKSARTCARADDDHGDDGDNGDNGDNGDVRAVVDEGGLVYTTKHRGSGTVDDDDADDDNAPLMDDLNVLSCHRNDDGASMNIEVSLRLRCKSCGMDVEDTTIPSAFSCSYCHVVAPRLYNSEDDDIVGSSSSSSSNYDSSVSSVNFSREANVEYLNIGLMLKVEKQVDGEVVGHPRGRGTRDDAIGNEDKSHVQTKGINDKMMMTMNGSDNRDGLHGVNSTNAKRDFIVGGKGRGIIKKDEMIDHISEQVSEDENEVRGSLREGTSGHNNHDAGATRYIHPSPNEDIVAVYSMPEVTVETNEVIVKAAREVVDKLDLLDTSQSQFVKNAMVTHPIKVVFVKNHAIAEEGRAAGQGGGDDPTDNEKSIEVPFFGGCGSALTFTHNFPSEEESDAGRDSSARKSALDKGWRSRQNNNDSGPLSSEGTLMISGDIINATTVSSNADAVSPPRLNKCAVVKSLITQFWQENVKNEPPQCAVSRIQPTTTDRNNIMGERVAPPKTDILAGSSNCSSRNGTDPPERYRADPPAATASPIADVDNISISGRDPPEGTDTISTSIIPRTEAYDQRWKDTTHPTPRGDDYVDSWQTNPNHRITTSLTELDSLVSDMPRNPLAVSRNYFAKMDGVTKSSCGDSFYSKWSTMRDVTMSSIVSHEKGQRDSSNPNVVGSDGTPSHVYDVDIRKRLKKLEFEFSYCKTEENKSHSNSGNHHAPSSESRQLATTCEGTTCVTDTAASLEPTGSISFPDGFDPPEATHTSMYRLPCTPEALVRNDNHDKDYSCLIETSHSKPICPISPTAAARRQRYKAVLTTKCEGTTCVTDTAASLEPTGSISFPDGFDPPEEAHTSMYRLPCTPEALVRNDNHDKDYSCLIETPHSKPICPISPTAAARRQRYKAVLTTKCEDTTCVTHTAAPLQPFGSVSSPDGFDPPEEAHNSMYRLPSIDGGFATNNESTSHTCMPDPLVQNDNPDKDYSRLIEAQHSKPICPISPIAAARRRRYKEYLIEKKTSLSDQSSSFRVSIE
jgi:hypothetical protein